MPIIDRRGAAIVSMIVVVLALAVAIPPFIAATGEDSSKTFTQTEGEDLRLTGTLLADLTDVRDGQSFTEVASIHTTDTDFNAAETLDNVTVEGSGESASVVMSVGETTYNVIDDSGDGGRDTTLGIAGDDTNDVNLERELKTVPSATGSVNQITLHIDSFDGSDYGFVVDIYAIQENPDGVYGEGTLVKDGWDPEFSASSQTIQLDTPIDVQSGESWTFEFITQTTDGNQNQDLIRVAADGNSGLNDWSSAEGSLLDRGGDISITISSGGSGTYVSSTHSADGADTGFTNVSLTDAEAEVTWIADTDGDGTFETEVSSDTRTSTGNYTVDLSGTSGQNWRVNVTFDATGGSPTAELHDEGVLKTTTGGTDVNVTLIDTETGQTVDTGPINESETRQFTIGMETVTVTNEDVLSDSRSLMTYEYPTYYGMGGGVETIVSNAPLIALALGFIIVVMALYAGRGV